MQNLLKRKEKIFHYLKAVLINNFIDKDSEKIKFKFSTTAWMPVLFFSSLDHTETLLNLDLSRTGSLVEHQFKSPCLKRPVEERVFIPQTISKLENKDNLGNRVFLFDITAK